jgi:hypothetical protein
MRLRTRLFNNLGGILAAIALLLILGWVASLFL